MQRWRTMTVGELIEGLARYRVFVLSLAAILVLAVVAPGARNSGETNELSSAGGSTAGGATEGGTDLAAGADTGQAADGAAGGGAIGSLTPGRTGGATGATGKASSIAPAVQRAGGGDPLAAPDCDAAKKRMRIPSIFAASCVPIFPKGADNGGQTYLGVSKDEIVVAIRTSEGNPAVSAIIVAAGAEDTDEDVRATRQHWIDLFTAHYETYGRKIKLVYYESSGSGDEAARADAIKVATEIKAFASFSGGGTHRRELTARGVVCICGAPAQEDYMQAPGLIWGTQPSFEQWFWPVGEYVGRRLWNRNAKHAGDPVYQQQKRRLAIVYSDSTTSPTNVRGVNFLEGRMAKYGAKFAEKIAYAPDINTAQEQSRVIVAKLKDAGITTVVFWGDALAPIFLTQESTRQAYRPEWVIVGGNLVDTTFFGRTYDPVQWEHAFGVSQLWARPLQENEEVFNLYNWHNGHSPEAAATYEIIYQNVWQLMTGVHLAGANLNPLTFKQALFSYPPSGGGPTSVHRSFGNHGIWPFDDYAAFDDSTEVWWDPNAVGTNEIGQEGKGMWAYVDGGKRHLPNAWPGTEPKVFVRDGTQITKYETLPPEDQFPKYEHKHFRQFQ